MSSIGSQKRHGFTLIELLVVLAIIVVLAAISAGVVTQVAITQAQKSDESLILKLNSELQKHWKAVIDRANEDPVPDGILTWAGGDADRARVIMRYLYVRNEFPQAYVEALTPVKIPLDTRPAGSANTDLPLNVQFLVLNHRRFTAGAPGSWPPVTAGFPYLYSYPYPFETYQTLQGANTPPGVNTLYGMVTFTLPGQPLYLYSLAPPPPANQTFARPVQLGYQVPMYVFPRDHEASTLLLLALQKPRRGTSGVFNVDETLAASALKDTINTPPAAPNPNNGISPPKPREPDQVQILDSNSIPVGFWRTPVGNPDVQFSGAAMPASNVTAVSTMNVLDPQGKLADPNWNSVYNMKGVYLFEDLTGVLIHTQTPPRDPRQAPVQPNPGSNSNIQWTPAPLAKYSSTPVIGTGGRDKGIGVFWGNMAQPPAAVNRNITRPTQNWVLDPKDADDNFYNYRLH